MGVIFGSGLSSCILYRLRVTSQSAVALLAFPRENRKYPDLPRRSKQTSRHKKKIGDRVLMVGRVRELALYRAEVLRQAGFKVVIAADEGEAVRIMQDSGFDAIVLSYTLSSQTVQYLAEAARDYCSDCPVVAIAETSMLDRRIKPDAVALADEGPTALLSALNRVLQP